MIKKVDLVALSAVGVGLSSCRPRGAAALGLVDHQAVRVVTFAEVITDLSALMNIVLVGSMVGLGLAFAVAFAVRLWAPMLARLSLGAAVGFAGVFGLAVMLKVSLPVLAWAVVAMLGMGIVSVAVVLRRLLVPRRCPALITIPEVVP